MSETPELPPYAGGPLHNPGTPGHDPRFSLVPDAAYVRREEIGDTQMIAQRIKELTSLADKKRQDELRTLIREEVHAAIYPGGLPDAHRHRRVRLIEEDGTEWRGMLYAVEEEAR